MLTTLQGKVALVTGGSRGIGFAIARALVADDVQVAIAGRTSSALSAARQKLERAEPGGRSRVETVTADVRRYAEA